MCFILQRNHCGITKKGISLESYPRRIVETIITTLASKYFLQHLLLTSGWCSYTHVKNPPGDKLMPIQWWCCGICFWSLFYNDNNGNFICVFECTVVNLATYRQFTNAVWDWIIQKKKKKEKRKEKKRKENQNCIIKSGLSQFLFLQQKM